MTYHLVDTHAHLDTVRGLERALAAAREAGVIAIVTIGGFESNRQALELARRHRSFVYPALGIHPGDLGGMEPSDVEDNLRFIEANIDEAVAVGEVGLDYIKRVVQVAPKDHQQAVFRDVLSLAKKHQKLVSIHSRYAWRDAFDLVQEVGVENAVFHWYTGPSSVLREIIAAGHFLSITPAAEYHAEHRRTVRECPLDRLLLETDCPVSYGREERYVASPSDVLRSLHAVAEIKGIDPSEVAKATSRNAARLFDISVGC